MAHGRRFSIAAQVNASAMGISASALMCGPSPYFANTPRRCGWSIHASPRNRGMKRKMGDISAVPTAPSHAVPRDLVATRINRYTPAIPSRRRTKRKSGMP